MAKTSAPPATLGIRHSALKAGPDMVAFRVERNGKVEIVPVEIREKKASPYSEAEWAKKHLHPRDQTGAKEAADKLIDF